MNKKQKIIRWWYYLNPFWVIVQMVMAQISLKIPTVANKIIENMKKKR